MPLQHITDVLDVAADQHSTHGVSTYPPGKTDTCQRMTYNELRQVAIENSHLLRRMDGFVEGCILLLHFDNHSDNIVWFWSTLYAGCIPAMSTPFVRSKEQCEKHLVHLRELLDGPICLTRSSLRDQFPVNTILRLQDVDQLPSLNSTPNGGDATTSSLKTREDGLTLLMLTSGSTGNAKAVRLTHQQILASVSGKSAFLPAENRSALLNWIGLDHVGSLIEIHICAMFVGAEQVHVQPADMISDPLLLLEMIDRHRVVRTFVPNFFLAELRRRMGNQSIHRDFDLTCLRYIASGGEANVVETCDAVSRLLARYGAPRNVIVPGFGMTETCAGSIFSLGYPEYDLDHQREFAAVGKCIPGVQMRVTSLEGDGTLVKPCQPGNLEITGPIVFSGYYNNQAATTEAFTADGWFKTGDIGRIDSEGNLILAGRKKEVIAINGVKYLPNELESIIEDANIQGITPSYTVCLSRWLPGAQTEQLCVIYLPDYTSEDLEARIKVLNGITKATLLLTGARPHVLPLDRSVLHKTTLGKLSPAKIKQALEKGEYKCYEDANYRIVQAFQHSQRSSPANALEVELLEVFQEVFGIPEAALDVNTTVLDMGVTSIELVKLKKKVEAKLCVKNEIPMIIMMTHTTVRSLAKALKEKILLTGVEYNPVVTLQPHGQKPPLWLVHPGVGEVLVFLRLAQLITDRPVYALRARGFNARETLFKDIDGCVTTYHAAIKLQQPGGPYAIAGYSYGSMLAFEIAKLLESNGDEVRFIGSLNLPPHIKSRMRQLGWTQCLLHLSYFLDLVSEEEAQSISPQLEGMQPRDAVAHVIGIAKPSRMAELSLTKDALFSWANLAFGLQNMARDYEPSGTVASLDVFYCNPLAIVGSSKAEWLAQHLKKWDGFTRSEPRFHEVDGSHYTMLDPEHVRRFYKTFNRALAARGL
jgi:acyl-CoA synthetase (AMP-forming)/AMP-acid ligase II/thioesterase domain-containing protein